MPRAPRAVRHRQRRNLARILHYRRGMNTTPSLWLVTGMAVGSFAALVAYAVRTLQQAAVLP